MANPNIVQTSAIYGKTDVLNVTTAATAITSNASSSGKAYKINVLVVSNVSAVGYPSVTVDLFRSSTAYRIANAVSVPPGSSVVVLSRDNPVYLNEGDSLRVTGSTASSLTAVCSYEEFS